MPQTGTGASIAIIAIAVLLLSIASFCLYAVDKQRAVRGSRRISEATLHAVDLLGGWPGGLLAQRVVRHKTRKTTFQIVFWITVLANLVMVFVLARVLMLLVR